MQDFALEKSLKSAISEEEWRLANERIAECCELPDYAVIFGPRFVSS